MQRSSDSPVVGLVAGAGALPIEAARYLTELGSAVRVIALKGLAAPELAAEVEALRWVTLGRLGETRDALRGLGIGALLLVGKVPKAVLSDPKGRFEPDEEAVSWLGGAAHAFSDENLLGLVGRWLAENGVSVLRQDEALSALLASEGTLGGRAESGAERADLAAAQNALRSLGETGNGQCVVMSEGRVLTLEEELGTDDAIRRAGEMTASPLTVVKGARPGQDLRFDLPAVGPETLRVMKEAGASALAIESGRTLLLSRAETLRAADAAGIAIWGFPLREARS